MLRRMANVPATASSVESDLVSTRDAALAALGFIRGLDRREPRGDPRGERAADAHHTLAQ